MNKKHKNDTKLNYCLGFVLLFVVAFILLSKFISRQTPSQTVTTLQESKSNIDYKKWIIIGFSDTDYIPIAKIWYSQLSNLGYENHYIISLSKTAYDELISQNIRTILAEKPSGEIHGSTKIKLHGLWGFRWIFILKLLNDGYNVLMSDIDSIWLNYLDLNSIPEKFDVMHTIAGKVPLNAYMHWGFTICGCMSAFRPKNRVKRLIRDLIKHCGNPSKLNQSFCDDQISLNNLYLGRYKMRWKILKEFDNSVFNGTRIGLSGDTKGLYIALTGNDLVSRTDFHTMNHMEPEYCEHYNQTWVINPHSKKQVKFLEKKKSNRFEPKKIDLTSNSPHTIDSKIQLFKDFKNCFLNKTKAEFPEVFDSRSRS